MVKIAFYLLAMAMYRSTSGPSFLKTYSSATCNWMVTHVVLVLRILFLFWCCSSCTFCSWRTAHSAQCQQSGCYNIPSFLQRTISIARSFYKGLHTARPSHPRYSTILLWSESLSGMCAKLCTVATSNNRVQPTRSHSSSPVPSTIDCSLASQA